MCLLSLFCEPGGIIGWGFLILQYSEYHVVSYMNNSYVNNEPQNIDARGVQELWLMAAREVGVELFFKKI